MTQEARKDWAMIDPGKEWQRLSATNRAMSDEDVLELRDDFANLTEVAQQASRDEPGATAAVTNPNG